MQKIILIIIAAIVNELAASQDESKLPNNYSLVTVDQHCNGDKSKLKMLTGTVLNRENSSESASTDLVAPWNLFVNFKPISPLSIHSGKY